MENGMVTHHSKIKNPPKTEGVEKLSSLRKKSCRNWHLVTELQVARLLWASPSATLDKRFLILHLYLAKTSFTASSSVCL